MWQIGHTKIHNQDLRLTAVNNDHSPLRRFFLTIIPGLEPVAHLELCEKWLQASAFYPHLGPYPRVDFFKGGIEFDAPISLGLQLNRNIRSVTRILIREQNFKAESEQDFIKGIEKVSWNDYFGAGDSFDLHFSSKSSRLSKDYQIQKILEKHLKKQKIVYQKGATKIFVRIFRDMCQISIDTTGERAQFRGGAKKIGKASLRESTAAGLLRILFQGVEEKTQLIDPMCGSGTFLIEALNMGSPIEREFLYQSFPIAKNFKNFDLGSEPVCSKVQGYDVDTHVLDLAKKNLSAYKKELWGLGKQSLFSKKVLRCAQDDSGSLKKIVVVNPPWGKRLQASSEDFLVAIDNKFKPDRIGMLIPAQWRFSKITLEKVRDVPVLNSGVENRFVVFAR